MCDFLVLAALQFSCLEAEKISTMASYNQTGTGF